MLQKKKKKNTFVAENACGSHFFCNLHPISKKAYIGEMLEWLKRHAWKARSEEHTSELQSQPRSRMPSSA